MTPEEDPPPVANPAAWLARRRWAKETPEERTANAKAAFKKRWGDNPEAVKEYMRGISRRPRPGSQGPRILDRCPCGRYSATLAAKRGHNCQAREPEPLKEIIDDGVNTGCSDIPPAEELEMITDECIIQHYQPPEPEPSKEETSFGGFMRIKSKTQDYLENPSWEPPNEAPSMDMCVFCGLSIGNDEATYTNDQGQMLHLTCHEIQVEENADYLEADGESD